MYKVWVLLLFSVALYGCAPEAPVDMPTPLPATPAIAAPTVMPTTAVAPAPALPTATPLTPVQSLPTPAPIRTVTSLPDELPVIECDTQINADEVPQEILEVRERLGYALRPSKLPAGFGFAGVSFNDNEVRQVYQNGDKNIIIAYPTEFSPDVAGPLGWKRPADAVSAISMGNDTAYLMIGGWSDASIIAGPALSPDKAEWDFDKSLAFFFKFKCRRIIGGGSDMAIQASPGHTNWIDAQALVDIAYSLERVTGN